MPKHLFRTFNIDLTNFFSENFNTVCSGKWWQQLWADADRPTGWNKNNLQD
jgi:hypothetical protein